MLDDSLRSIRKQDVFQSQGEDRATRLCNIWGQDRSRIHRSWRICSMPGLFRSRCHSNSDVAPEGTPGSSQSLLNPKSSRAFSPRIARSSPSANEAALTVATGSGSHGKG